MFYTYAILCTIFYALNNTLMVDLFRKVNLPWVVTLRGFGIGVAMSPLLFLVPKDDFKGLVDFIPLFILACMVTFFGNICNANAFKNLPIGIACAASMSFCSIFSGIFSFLILDEILNGLEILVLGLILMGIMAIGFTDMQANIKVNIKKGVLSSACFGLLISIAFIITATISRANNPLAVGYFWETGVGIIGLSFLIIRSFFKKEDKPTEYLKYFPKIILFSIPAAVGAACYSLSVSSGPVAIVAAIMGTMMVANSIFAWLINNENLTKIQWVLVLIISILVVTLKFVGK